MNFEKSNDVVKQYHGKVALKLLGNDQVSTLPKGPVSLTKLGGKLSEVAQGVQLSGNYRVKNSFYIPQLTF